MIISHTLKYVYIGIPRTGSKSMNRWLMDHYEGEWYDEHHSWQVPDEAKDYLIFTTVRNPYDRAMSGWFGIAWGAPAEYQPKPVSLFAEEVRRTLPLKDGTVKLQDHDVPEAGMNQYYFAQNAGVSLALFFEHLPRCLHDLPFVDPATMPPFPHREERGKRPPGNFFAHFNAEDEQAVWEYNQEDFEAFGYRRFDCGGPEVASLRLRQPSST